MNLRPDETDLIGSWTNQDGKIVGDPVDQRITQLISSSLERVATSLESGGWNTLYRDPRDGRYWELSYPQSEVHGGGPKRLTNLSAADAVAKYDDGKTRFF